MRLWYNLYMKNSESKDDCKPLPTACVPAMRADSHWWALARHAEILGRLAGAENNDYELALVGDSIMHRWENPVNGAAVYPELTNRYKVLNLGDGGDCTQNVLWRFEHGALGQDYPYTTKLFAVMIGVNNGPDNPEETAAGVKLILDKLEESHPEAKIILMPILPLGDEPLKDPRMTVINPILKSYADEKRIFWLDFNDRFLDENGHIKPGLMMPDNVHPIEGGYRIWAEALCPVVDRLLGK